MPEALHDAFLRQFPPLPSGRQRFTRSLLASTRVTPAFLSQTVHAQPPWPSATPDRHPVDNPCPIPDHARACQRPVSRLYSLLA